jgi:hypothetical protein
MLYVTTQQNSLINLLLQTFLNILSILNLPDTTSMLLTNTTFLMDNIQWHTKTEFIGMFHLYTNQLQWFTSYFHVTEK